MCDYSLELIMSRPAKAGDKLVSTSFPHTSTRGFASVEDRNVAVCLLPGTELSFEKEVQRSDIASLSFNMSTKTSQTFIMTLWNFPMGRSSC